MSEIYSSSGKKYNGEKAIISLTSWKARINTVSKTLFSLIQQCPGFHIVLVLSEEEFPKKEAELPENLMLFVNNNLIELLWVYKNYKSFKKILFTMDKYRTVPIISADDDCIYNCNYAEEFYKVWIKNKTCCISTYNKILYKNIIHHQGCSTLYPPNIFNKLNLNISEKILNTFEDDILYSVYLNSINCKTLKIEKNTNDILKFHDSIEPLDKIWSGNTIKNFKIVEEELKLCK